jgi:hypothetical protein
MRTVLLAWTFASIALLTGCAGQACDEVSQGSVTPFQCSLPSPCPVATLNGYASQGSTRPDSGSFQDPAAATCILAALRDRSIARLSFGYEGNGPYSHSEEVFIVDVAHGVSNWTDFVDLSTTNGVRRHMLKPASYFDGCSKLTDPAQTYNCMADWYDGCADTSLSCPVP